MKQRQRKRGPYDPQTLTKAVTHIRLEAINAGKLAALDDLAQMYLPLCQQYITLFCTDEHPHKLRAPLFATPLSERWQRVAIQQAAGTAKSWLTISTLAFRKQLLVPVKLADYHREALKGKAINSSVTLNKRGDEWWLTLSYDQVVAVQTEPSAPVVGVDVGIANFLTTSDGQHYGTFRGKLRERHKRDREKRRRKAKLRACLEKKGVKQLPSTSSKSGQRLARHVRQEINRAVNQCFAEHEGAQFAYTSQECSVCHSVDRANRPNQQTFCCRVCGYSAHADLNAAVNIRHRLGDEELRACKISNYTLLLV